MLAGTVADKVSLFNCDGTESLVYLLPLWRLGWLLIRSQVLEMYRARTQLLEAIVPTRSRDVSEIIRLHTLCEVEKLMRQDPEMYLSNKWTARVFLMIHDPAVEVRLKAIQVIPSWYPGINAAKITAG